MSSRKYGGPEGREESTADPSDKRRRFENLLKSEDAQRVYLASLVLVLGVVLGYFFHGDCGGIEQQYKIKLEERDKVIVLLTKKFEKLEENLQTFLSATLTPKIESKLDELGNQISQKLEASGTEIKNNINEVTNSLKDTDRQLKDSLEAIQSTERQISKSQEELSESLTTLKETSDTWNRHIGEISTKGQKIVTELHTSKTALETSVAEFKTNSEETITGLKTTQEESTKKIESMTAHAVGALAAKNSEKVSEIEMATSSFRKATEEGSKAFTDFVSTLEGVTSHSREIKGAAELIQANADALNQSSAALEDNLNHIDQRLKTLSHPSVGYSSTCSDKNSSHYVTWSLLIIGFALVLVLQRKGQRFDDGAAKPAVTPTPMPKAQRARTPPRTSPAMTVSRTSGAPRVGAPEYDITVVAFSEETLDQSRNVFYDMVGTAWPGPARVEYKLLSGTLDLSQIPPSRGYIVVIGFDARNSIVEDMDGSMGSRKRETVSGLLKTPGDVLVVYIDNDDQLGEPPEGALYNPHLERPTSHPLLRPLVNRQRFISLRRWRWTRTQAAHIENWVQGLK